MLSCYGLGKNLKDISDILKNCFDGSEIHMDLTAGKVKCVQNEENVVRKKKRETDYKQIIGKLYV